MLKGGGNPAWVFLFNRTHRKRVKAASSSKRSSKRSAVVGSALPQASPSRMRPGRVNAAIVGGRSGSSPQPLARLQASAASSTRKLGFVPPERTRAGIGITHSHLNARYAH